MYTLFELMDLLRKEKLTLERVRSLMSPLLAETEIAAIETTIRLFNEVDKDIVV